MTKYIILFSLLILSSLLKAQVAIGKTTVDGSGILDFGNGNRGLIMNPINLPSCNSGTIGGIAANASTGQLAVCNGVSWNNMGSVGSSTSVSGSDLTTQGVIIGADTSSRTGVLIMESSNKAVILPKTNYPDFRIKDPETGTVFYDTGRKALLYFNGTKWTVL